MAGLTARRNWHDRPQTLNADALGVGVSDADVRPSKHACPTERRRGRLRSLYLLLLGLEKAGKGFPEMVFERQKPTHEVLLEDTWVWWLCESVLVLISMNNATLTWTTTDLWYISQLSETLIVVSSTRNTLDVSTSSSKHRMNTTIMSLRNSSLYCLFAA